MMLKSIMADKYIYFKMISLSILIYEPHNPDYHFFSVKIIIHLVVLPALTPCAQQQPGKPTDGHLAAGITEYP